MKRLAALAAGLVTAASLRSASAQVVTEDVRVEYRAPKGCPTEDWAIQRISARTDLFRRVLGPARARTFAIDITESGAGYTGTLTITDPGDTRGTSRRIEAKSCDEVTDGLALIAALTIDPQAKLDAPVEEPAAEPEPKEPAQPPAPARRPAPRRVPAEPEALTVPYARAGAGFLLVHGAAPVVLHGAEGFVEIGRAGARTWFSPAIRLNGRTARHDAVAYPEGTAHFRLSTLALDLCPLRAAVPMPSLRLCATGELGWLEAEGTDVPEARQSRRGWAAVGGVLRAAASVSRIGLELSLGAEAPLRRDRFRLVREIGQVELLVLFGSLNLTGYLD